MAIIKVPTPPQSAMNKERPVSSLLKTQLVHMQEAEFRLPARAQTNVYINSIKTEAQAADYIRRVTEALHEEHGAMTKPVKKSKARPVTLPSIAGAANRKSSSRKKTSSSKKKAGSSPRSKHKK